jgi:hypothetical protein
MARGPRHPAWGGRSALNQSHWSPGVRVPAGRGDEPVQTRWLLCVTTLISGAAHNAAAEVIGRRGLSAS